MSQIEDDIDKELKERQLMIAGCQNETELKELFLEWGWMDVVVDNLFDENDDEVEDGKWFLKEYQEKEEWVEHVDVVCKLKGKQLKKVLKYYKDYWAGIQWKGIFG